MKKMETEAIAQGRDVIKVHAGDALTGTTFYTFFKFAPDAAVINAYPFDAIVAGNHEFDDVSVPIFQHLQLLKLMLLHFVVSHTF